MAAREKNPDEILSQAVEISDPTEREVFLGKACGGDEVGDLGNWDAD